MLDYLKNVYFSIILGGCFSLLTVEAISQSTVVTNQKIEVTFNKTSNIVFPAAITSVDRGSQDILAQKAKQVENVLQVKAGRMNMPETNLTIITADGHLHHFTITYSDKPKTQTVLAPLVASSNGNTEYKLLFSDAVDLVELSRIAQAILIDRSRRNILSNKKFGMRLSLKEILINEDVVFYKMQISNKSHINYDIKSLRFYVRDRIKAKRTAFQEIEMLPILIQGEKEKVKGGSTINMIYALQKFTIPDAKALEIDLVENNGGRNLKIRVSNNIILKARTMPLR